MTQWQPVSTALWQGRDDRAEAANALRLCQTIEISRTFSPGHYRDRIALLGFACDEGVKRNHGRPGAAGAPDALRKALANLACHAGHERLVDMGNILAPGRGSGRGATGVKGCGTSLPAGRCAHLCTRWGHETAFGHGAGVYDALRLNASELSILTLTRICVSPDAPVLVRRFANWRNCATSSSVGFTMPALASAGRQIPVRCGMRRKPAG